MTPSVAPATSDRGERVAIVTLGCARNDVDSDQLSAALERDGFRVVADPTGADAIVVNTCTFVTPATEESIDTVLEATSLKQEGTRAVIVTGCMAQRYGDELAATLPEADAIVGFEGYERLPSIVADVLDGRSVTRFHGSPDVPDSARQLPLAGGRPTDPMAMRPVPASGPAFPERAFDGRPYAYLKIASGCDRTCTFCAIPTWRGRFRSRPLDELVAEARWLVERGARELVCVSENTTSWGKDLDGGRASHVRLLEGLVAIDGLERVRLMYLQPAEIQRPLLEAMAALPKVASYFDLSLQHAAAPVLRRMSRKGSDARFLELIGSIRELDPAAAFRSSFIVGFPGETEGDVETLATFLTQARLDWAGFFAYSPQEGTSSALMPLQVPPDATRERLEMLTALQDDIADAAAAAFVGRRLDVTVERVDEDGPAGRSYREAPETDGECRLLDADVPVGRTVPVEVVASDGVDLVGRVLVDVDGVTTRRDAGAHRVDL